MNTVILSQVPAWLIAVAIFLLMLLLNWIGFQMRKRQLKITKDELDSIGTIEGAMLGLLALFLAFSFGMAATKFDERRKIIIDEANNIGTAILRCDLYNDSVKRIFLRDFSDYLDARIAYFNASADNKKVRDALRQTELISAKIWNRAVTLPQSLEDRIRTMHVVPALNSMIDIVTARESSRESKVPPLILLMLLILTFVSAFLIGYNYKAQKRNMVMIVGFAVMSTLALYLVMELDRPRRGAINLNAAQAKIEDLRKLIQERQ